MEFILKNYKYEVSDRATELFTVIALFLTFVLSNVVFHSAVRANDLIASNPVVAPSLMKAAENIASQINPRLMKDEFEREMAQKYSGLRVYDVADGIKHIKTVKYFNGRPVKLNIIEMSLNVARDFEIKPATASTLSLSHKASLRAIADRTNSIVAINGGFFKPQTGVPLGTLMIDGKLYTGPIYNRAAIGITDYGFESGRVEFHGSISANGYSVKIDNINQPRMLSSYVLVYTRDWGSYAPAAPQYGVGLQIDEAGRVVKASANPLFIPENGYVISGPKDKLGAFFGAEDAQIRIETGPKWQGVKHIISGGPYLVRNGEIFVDTVEEKLQSIGGRNPRTAIGYTAENNFIIVTADGREGSSVGLTLNELARFMESLGCVNAINLDGGGSTVMYVNGQIVNSPAQVGGIGLSNALVITQKE